MKILYTSLFILFINLVIVKCAKNGTESDRNEKRVPSVEFNSDKSEIEFGRSVGDEPESDDAYYDDYDQGNEVSEKEVTNAGSTSEGKPLPTEVFLSMRNLTEEGESFRNFKKRNDVEDLQASASDNVHVNDSTNTTGWNSRAYRDARYPLDIGEAPLQTVILPYQHTKVDTADLSDCARQGEWRPIGEIHIDSSQQNLQQEHDYLIPGSDGQQNNYGLVGDGFVGGDHDAHSSLQTFYHNRPVQNSFAEFQKLTADAASAHSGHGGFDLGQHLQKYVSGSVSSGHGSGFADGGLNDLYKHTAGNVLSYTQDSADFGKVPANHNFRGHGGFAGHGGLGSGGGTKFYHGQGNLNSVAGGGGYHKQRPPGHGLYGSGSFGSGSFLKHKPSSGYMRYAPGGFQFNRKPLHGNIGDGYLSFPPKPQFSKGKKPGNAWKIQKVKTRRPNFDGLGTSYKGTNFYSGGAHSDGGFYGGGQGSGYLGGHGGFGSSGSLLTSTADEVTISSGGHAGLAGDGGLGGHAGHSALAGLAGDGGLGGHSGHSGFAGHKGHSGHKGHGGLAGDGGLGGHSGHSVVAGLAGDGGLGGHSGYSGHAGLVADAGIGGHSGYSGHAGLVADAGVGGHSGYSGHAGLIGDAGIGGHSGYSGHAGLVGDAGLGGFGGLGGHGEHAENLALASSAALTGSNVGHITHEAILQDASQLTSFTCGKNHDHGTNYHTASFQVSDDDHGSQDVLQYQDGAHVIIHAANNGFEDVVHAERKQLDEGEEGSGAASKESNSEIITGNVKGASNHRYPEGGHNDENSGTTDQIEEPSSHNYYREGTKFSSTENSPIQFGHTQYEKGHSEPSSEKPKIIRELEDLSSRFQLDLDQKKSPFANGKGLSYGSFFADETGEDKFNDASHGSVIHNGFAIVNVNDFEINPKDGQFRYDDGGDVITEYPYHGLHHESSPVSDNHYHSLPVVIAEHHPAREEKPKAHIPPKRKQPGKQYEVHENSGEKHKPATEIFPPQKFPRQFHNPTPNFAGARPTKSDLYLNKYPVHGNFPVLPAQYKKYKKYKTIPGKVKYRRPVVVRRPVTESIRITPAPVVRVSVSS